jgi:two-component system phosphate regulon response regulator PhoB
VPRLGRVEIDMEARRAWVDGAPCGLTPTEFRLLVHLTDRVGQAVLREDLAALVRTDQPVACTLQSHVSRLRRKLGPAADQLETVWGLGYRFIAP